MAGPGNETAGRRGHLRASHADREQAIEVLKAAFVQGRLVKDEFDARVGQAFAARTYADLAAVTADLPTGPAAVQPPKSVRAPGEQPVLRPGPVIAGASAVYAGVWASVVFLATHSADGAPWAAPLIFGGFLVYLFILIMSVVQMAALRREKRSGGQSSGRPGVGGPASQRLPSAGPGRRVPLADPGRGHTAEAAPVVRPRLVPS
jgi:hypothetical protein